MCYQAALGFKTSLRCCLVSQDIFQEAVRNDCILRQSRGRKRKEKQIFSSSRSFHILSVCDQFTQQTRNSPILLGCAVYPLQAAPGEGTFHNCSSSIYATGHSIQGNPGAPLPSCSLQPHGLRWVSLCTCMGTRWGAT